MLAIVVITLVALAATLAVVPCRDRIDQLSPDPHVYAEGDMELDWIWNMGPQRPYTLNNTPVPRTMRWTRVPVWGLVLLEHCALLLIGGGLLSWAMRRRRGAEGRARDAP